MENLQLTPVARMESDFPEKFGVPRQSGLVESLRSRVVFAPEFRNPDALRGLEGFSHLWLIWGFHRAQRSSWSPTVRPPRLGGNRRMGVFATRSPFRPNPLGLSCVKLERVELQGPEGPVLYVSGADLMDGTPIYDLKPYLPYTDSHPEAREGFAPPPERLEVKISPELAGGVPPHLLEALKGVLALDPRPHYHDDPGRVYGMSFAGLEVQFFAQNDQIIVQNIDVGEKDESFS